MKISFNIPTYNRAKFLKKNLNILATQIIELHKENEVEINISDNASRDDTKSISEAFISAYPQLHVSYHCNEKNLGPDGNFITAMHLAKGEYSLLWGDDDFLKEGGLARIFELVEYGENKGIQIMMSSTSVCDSKGRFLFNKNFLREDIKEAIVDFSDVNERRSYFFLLSDMGGMLSFISDVIYKTSIIQDRSFDKDFLGTHYAFLYYWWGWLLKGNKLYYSNQSFLYETYQFQPAYGVGIDRMMVDYNGYLLIANKLISDECLRIDFLSAFQRLHSLYNLITEIDSERYKFKNVLLPALKECGFTDKDITDLYNFCSTKNQVKRLLHKILPYEYINKLRKVLMKMKLYI